MTFGEALEALKSGRSIERDAWSGQFVRRTARPQNAQAADIKRGITIFYLMAPGGQSGQGWNPGIQDLMAEDWRIIE